jgi:hypothetical protein
MAQEFVGQYADVCGVCYAVAAARFTTGTHGLALCPWYIGLIRTGDPSSTQTWFCLRPGTRPISCAIHRRPEVQSTARARTSHIKIPHPASMLARRAIDVRHAESIQSARRLSRRRPGLPKPIDLCAWAGMHPMGNHD